MNDIQKFNETIEALEKGQVRVAEKVNGSVSVHCPLVIVAIAPADVFVVDIHM